MLTAIYSGVRGSMRWALMPIYRGHGDYTLLFTVVFLWYELWFVQWHGEK